MGSFLPPRPIIDPRRYGISAPLEELEPDGAQAEATGLSVGGVTQPRYSTAIGMFQGGGPGAMPMPGSLTDIASPVVRPAAPAVPVPVDVARARMGLPPIETPAQAPTSIAADIDTEGDRAARARILSGVGAWQPTDIPWGGDVPGPGGTMLKSGLQQAIDDREHAIIDDRHARSYATIDATARNPQEDQIRAASTAAVYEDLIPKQRPLFDIGDPSQEGGVAGAFHQGADGTISNRLPAMRLGPERQALIAQAPEMRRQTQLANVVSGLEKIQAGIQADLELYAKTGGKQGMSPLDAQKAYERAERLAGLALQSISGGKDFGEFFRPQDPLQTTMALMMGQKAAE